MKVIILTDLLQKKLSFLNHAISTKNQLPILLNFFLQVSTEKLTIRATDLEIGIETTIPMTEAEEGEVVIPAKIFTELVNALPGEKITIEKKEGKVEITSNKTKSTIQLIENEEYPVIYEEKGDEIMCVKGKELKENMSRVVFAASLDTTKPSLSGILLKTTGEKITFVATDGFRLSLKEAKKSENKKDAEQSILIPVRLAREVFNMNSDQDIHVFVSQRNNQILFSQDEVVVVGRLIEATYPNYTKILPTETATRTSFDREEFMHAVKTSAIFAREATNTIKLSLRRNAIIVSAKSPNLGENNVEVEAQTTGEENEIAFNVRFLQELLGNVDVKEMVFEMTGPLNPGVFKPMDDSSFLHLIMPIRMQG